MFNYVRLSDGGPRRLIAKVCDGPDDEKARDDEKRMQRQGGEPGHDALEIARSAARRCLLRLIGMCRCNHAQPATHVSPTTNAPTDRS